LHNSYGIDPAPCTKYSRSTRNKTTCRTLARSVQQKTLEIPDQSAQPIRKEAHMNLENQWPVYRTRFLVRARQLTQPLVFTDILGREQSGQVGDYIVQSADGMRRITPQALFEDIYVPMEQNDGASAVLAPPVPRSAPENRTRVSA
jgi:hypothetical protein